SRRVGATPRAWRVSAGERPGHPREDEMTNRGWCLLARVLAGVLACATPKPAADTAVSASAVNAANAIDTLKPAVGATPDSARATAAASTKTNTRGTKPSSK